MTIVQKITNSIKAAMGDDFAVYYHDDPTLNLMTQTMEFPCAIFLLLTTGNADREGGTMKERVTASVFFVEPSQFDFDADENEVIIDRCKGRAFEWLMSLNGSEYVDLVELTRTSRTYDRYDDILTGYGVQADIREMVGFTGCHPSGDFNNDFNNDFNII